jgi:hypothetical protein
MTKSSKPVAATRCADCADWRDAARELIGHIPDASAAAMSVVLGAPPDIGISVPVAALLRMQSLLATIGRN